MDLLPFLEQWQMLPEEDGVILCAVSGGRDSMCLLYYLWELGQRRSFSVAAGHLNHAMRPEADSDEAFVRAFCDARQIPFYSVTVPVYEKAQEWHLTVEETGRRARYQFLEQTADAIGAGRIATAHHLNDQAETVLLNLLRGSGLQGLCGIPPVRGRYIRPLLNTPREEIEQYNAENGIGHVEDSTNSDTGYARNRLRLTIWPELTAINPAARQHIADCAAIARQENDYLNTLAAEILPQRGTAVSCGKLLALPEVLQIRAVRLLLDRLPAGKKDVSAAHYRAIVQLCRSGGMLELPGAMRAVCRNGTLTLSVNEQNPGETPLPPGQTCWGSYTITVSEAPPARGGLAFSLQRDALPALTVRSWRGHDRLMLPGSRGSRSIKRLFADRGIPGENRDTVPVICIGGKAAAVYGIGQSADSMPGSADTQIYVSIRFQKTNEI